MHDDGSLCFLDFGIAGQLTPRDQENLRQLFLAFMVRDADCMADVYFEMGVAAPEIDRSAFVRDLHESIAQYFSAPRDYTFAEILRQFIRLGQRHQVRVLREALLIAKAFMTVEAQARELDPKFDMLTAFQEYVPRMIAKGLLSGVSQAADLARGYRNAARLQRAAVELPDTAVRLLRRLRSGGATIRVRHEL